MEFFGNPYIIAGVVALVTFTLYMAIISTTSQRTRLRRFETKDPVAAAAKEAIEAEDDLVSLEAEKSALASLLAGLLKLLGVNVDEEEKKTARELNQAGVASPQAPIYVLFMRRLGGYLVAFVGVLYMLKGGEGTAKLLSVSVGIIIIFLGLCGTNLLIKNKALKRQNILQRGFPDTLDLLVVCVESGLALDAALARVCQELGRAHPEITRELNRTRLELALLNDRTQALQNLADRTNLVAFRSLVASLIQTEKFGTSLTDTLRVLSDDYRQTRLMYAENKAGRLPVVMTIPLILLLLPALFLIILGPPFLRVSQRGGLFPDKKAEEVRTEDTQKAKER